MVYKKKEGERDGEGEGERERRIGAQLGAISRFKGERPVRVRVQLDFMFIRLVPDEKGRGRKGEGGSFC